MSNSMIAHCLWLFLAALGGGALVLLRRWSDEHLHYILSLGAGVFLGLVFVHLMPETIESANPDTIGYYILAGFMFLFFVERILFTRGDGSYDHGHHVVGLTAMIGLSIHALMDGLGLNVTELNPSLGTVMFISILAHKIPAAVALTSFLALAKLPYRRIWLYLVIFSLMTPLGALVLGQIPPLTDDSYMPILTGLVTGSFLYIATGELLPEVFHGRHRQWIKLALLIIGALSVTFLGADTGHVH